MYVCMYVYAYKSIDRMTCYIQVKDLRRKEHARARVHACREKEGGRELATCMCMQKGLWLRLGPSVLRVPCRRM